MEPITWGALLSAGSNVLGSALKGGGSPSSRAESFGYSSSAFDSSGWTITFGNKGALSPSLSSGGAAGVPLWVWITAAAVGVYLWKKR